VELYVGREAEAGGVRAGDDAGDKGAVAEAVCEAVLVGPVGAVLDVADVGVVLPDACVKHADLLGADVFGFVVCGGRVWGEKVQGV
jgi:hypothetical protein